MSWARSVAVEVQVEVEVEDVEVEDDDVEVEDGDDEVEDDDGIWKRILFSKKKAMEFSRDAAMVGEPRRAASGKFLDAQGREARDMVAAHSFFLQERWDLEGVEAETDRATIEPDEAAWIYLYKNKMYIKSQIK